MLLKSWETPAASQDRCVRDEADRVAHGGSTQRTASSAAICGVCTRIWLPWVSTGSYDRVAAFARSWRQAQQELARTAGRGTFVPLTFAPGEAFQFDWSEDWAVVAGERIKLQVAQFKLSYSRAFVLRAYPLQTHEMLFDAHAPRIRRPRRRSAPRHLRQHEDGGGPGPGRQGAGCQRRVSPAMVSHYLFEAEFCNPAAGWEKGQIEKNVQDSRHRLWHARAGVCRVSRR